jgi:uncharacterized protein (DUF2235 family)
VSTVIGFAVVQLTYYSSLAGMIRRVGLLTADNFEQIPFAYEIYAQRGEDGKKRAKAFREAFSRNVEVEFVGVWFVLCFPCSGEDYRTDLYFRDTVSSVGVAHKRLPFTAWNNNNKIKTFRHAISLDERRAKFKPKFCKGKDLLTFVC